MNETLQLIKCVHLMKIVCLIPKSFRFGLLYLIVIDSSIGFFYYHSTGEADRGRGNYNCTFPAMIADWRTKFNQGSDGQTDAQFPFGFVQACVHIPVLLTYYFTDDVIMIFSSMLPCYDMFKFVSLRVLWR